MDIRAGVGVTAWLWSQEVHHCWWAPGQWGSGEAQVQQPRVGGACLQSVMAATLPHDAVKGYWPGPQREAGEAASARVLVFSRKDEPAVRHGAQSDGR